MKLRGSVVFSLAIAFLVVNAGAHPSGSVALGLGPGSAPMQVDVRAAQAPTSTVLNSMVFLAAVTSDGLPVPSAVVNFSDSFKSEFLASSVTTNSSGVAVAEVVFINPNPKNDTITASAAAPGYDPAKGTVVVYVLPLSNQQLAVTETVVDLDASGGSSEVIHGQVGTVYSSSTKWNGFITGIPDCSVTFSDSIGSTFPPVKVTTDNSGYYSANFTLGDPASNITDIVAVNATSPYYNGSVSTIELPVGAYSPGHLTVALNSLYPSTYSTILGLATFQARVTAGGSPVAGAPVTFSDSLGGLLVSQSGATDSDGIATATVYYVYQSTGVDVFTARATEAGLSPGVGSNLLNVRPNTKTQLSVSVEVASARPASGGTDTLTGEVGWVGGSTSYAWSPAQTPVAGASVTISDSLTSFAPITTMTNEAGIYSASFTVPSAPNSTDVIVASASDKGYQGSTSSLFVIVGDAQDPNSTQASSTLSARTSSTASSTFQGSGISTASTGSLTNPGTRSPYLAAVLPAVVGVVVAGTLLVYRFALAGRKRTPPQ